MQLLCELFYLVCMDNQYATLQILAQIVQEESNPTHYLCTPREMILHSKFDWEIIHVHLLQLRSEELVSIIEADTIKFSITKNGLRSAMQTHMQPEKELQVSFKEEIITK